MEKSITESFILYFLPGPRCRKLREYPIKARSRIEAIHVGRKELFRRWPNFVLINTMSKEKAEVFARLAQ